jgi:hypothetical protein
MELMTVAIPCSFNMRATVSVCHMASLLFRDPIFMVVMPFFLLSFLLV